MCSFSLVTKVSRISGPLGVLQLSGPLDKYKGHGTIHFGLENRYASTELFVVRHYVTINIGWDWRFQ